MRKTMAAAIITAVYTGKWTLMEGYFESW
jgi:hypothetical protein